MVSGAALALPALFQEDLERNPVCSYVICAKLILTCLILTIFGLSVYVPPAALSVRSAMRDKYSIKV